VAGLLASKYAADLQVGADAFLDYQLTCLAPALDGRSRTTLMVAREDDAAAMLLLEFLPWDSEIFGFGIGRVSWLHAAGDEDGRLREALLRTALRRCREWKIRHLSARVDPSDVAALHALERQRFTIADVSVALGAASRDLPETPPEARIRPFAPEDLPALRAIAGSAFRYSRLVADGRFPRERANALFERWIENLCRGRADQVLVAVEDRGVAGFVACTLDRRAQTSLGFSQGDISLVGVAPDRQGNGLGRALVGAGLAWLKPRAERIEIRTQLTNLPALRLYEKAGFRIVRGLYTPGGVTFHRWM
jgi:ribosomal protein S18 acetylase RimI-like enzyme